MNRPRVIVRGSIMQAPLLDTEDASIVEFYDQHGELTAVFGKVLSDEFWSFSSRNDEDWAEVLARMGYINGTHLNYELTNAKLDHATSTSDSRTGPG